MTFRLPLCEIHHTRLVNVPGDPGGDPLDADHMYAEYGGNRMSKKGQGVAKKAAKKASAKARALSAMMPAVADGLGPHDTVMAVQEVLKPLLRAKDAGIYQNMGLNGVMADDYNYGQLDFTDLINRELPQGLASNGYTFPGANADFIDKYLHLTGIALVPAVAARTTYP